MRFDPELPQAVTPMALAGHGENHTECWFDCGPTAPVGNGATSLELASFSGRQGPTLTFIGACVEVTNLADMRQITYRLYSELLDAMTALGVPRFVRIWNYIPQINTGSGDNECYRQFCWGRAEALGDISLPAATGIGSRDGWLRIGALCTGPAGVAGSIGIAHIENTRQLSAYHYPKDYGPRSPSFARATLVSPAQDQAGQSLLLVSGTSSIVHHQTMHAGDIAAQSAETMRNIQALFNSLNASSSTRPAPVPLALRYYLRNNQDLAPARSSWAACAETEAGLWPSPAWYQADICRSDLAMEVEGVFSV